MYVCIYVCNVCFCVYVCVCLSVCFPLVFPSFFVCLFRCWFACLLVCLCQFVCLFVCFACLLVCLPVCLFACLFVCLLVCLFACLLVCLFACLLVCLFACLLVCLFVWLLGCLVACLFVYCHFLFFLSCCHFVFCWRSWRKSLHYPWVPTKHRRVASPHPVCDCCRIPSHPHLKNHQKLWNPVESQTAKRRGRVKKHPDFVFRMASSTCPGWISYKIHIQSGFASWSGHSTMRSDTCQTVLATLENSCTFESRVLQFVRIRLSKIYKIFNGFSLSATGFDSNVPSSRRDLALKGLGAENGARPANDASAGSMPKIHCLVNHRKHQEAKTMSPYVTVCHRITPKRSKMWQWKYKDVMMWCEDRRLK